LSILRTDPFTGFEHILFNSQPQKEVIDCVVAYIESLKPVPSPYLDHGKLSRSALRGEKVFENAGCADCHTPGLFMDSTPHDVGTRASLDNAADEFYTPTLVELWRTAPYLHDGSAPTIRDAITARNPAGNHGRISSLSAEEIEHLCAYLLSL
jgi:cytochrome c peroxidase